MHPQQLCDAALRSRAPHHALGMQLGGLAQSVEEAVEIAQQANRAAQQRNAHQCAHQDARLPAHAHGDVLVRIAHREYGVFAHLQPHAFGHGRSAEAPELRHILASLDINKEKKKQTARICRSAELSYARAIDRQSTGRQAAPVLLI